MDEQQIMQLLNQIPLDVLQQYVAQRTQQEQAAVQQQGNEAAYMQGAADAQHMMARGGYINPMVDIYACGGHTGRMPTGKMLPSTKGKRK